ncbi:HlyD family secretion protein [Vibrio mediterranei]|jgi:membrane fusion protein|uniref:HlyD family secretion protein n=1 Tax=Vibrio mediterranei TaxID=689 RepID=UPI0022851C4D|nr:HlyD family efflux transporter periplasmic adaptor subunit [Vibrio mediterranei]MCY9855126.1 HlyD family efflux transporter periplasmic adaptor subunit [Vibrio mediterranei]
MFRKEAIASKQHRLLGEVIMTQPRHIYRASSIVFLFFIAIIIFLSQANYSRKTTVMGYISPEKGVVKVYTARSGTIEKIYVKPGDSVKLGDNLVKIINSQSLSTGVELSLALEKELIIQKSILQKELMATRKFNDKEKLRLESQLEQSRKSILALNTTKKTKQEILILKEKQLNKNKGLAKVGYISDNNLDIIKEEYLSALESFNRLEREISNMNLEITALEHERKSLPEQSILREAEVQRKISEIKTSIMEIDNQFEFVEKAPESGIVATIHPVIGSRVSENTPLLSIIPKNSPLEIELLLPTSAAGFVSIGDKVNIRYDAFPYQKFGVKTGYISNIDKILILPSEKVLPINVDEAMYRAKAKLDEQLINAYGMKFPLKVGMTAEADIILEKRTLLEWLLDPIYAVKGRLG